MRYAAFVCIAVALFVLAYFMWRCALAVAHRDEQPADANDVCFAVAAVGFFLALSTLGLTFAVLA